MKRLFPGSIRLCIVIISVLVPSQLRVDASDPQQEIEDALQLTISPTATANVRKEFWHGPVVWNGREYAPSEAALVLTGIAIDPDTDPVVRKKAFDVLDKLANQLGGTKWVGSLIELYDAIDDRNEKAATLMLLLKAEDPRAFPLFSKVLAGESDHLLFFTAASGLARWNVRCGVAALIDLFECGERLPNDRALGDEALIAFASLNRSKGWKWPEEDIQSIISGVGDEKPDSRRRVIIRETKKWFEANKDRFPDWKPGDPLPEIPVDDKDKPDDE